MFLERISNFLVKNRKKMFFYAFFALILFILSSDISFAADKAQEDATRWLKIFNSIVAGLASIVGIFTYFVTMLLDPAYTNGSLFGIDEKLHEVWILVSNVVYFIFAFILIWIAFMNILGKGDSKWELKQAMPKFIVGVFIVPFSWFFVGLIVSISNLLTIAALALPSDTFMEYKSYLEQIEIPKTCTINLFDVGDEDNSNGASGSNGASQGGESDGQWMSCEDEKINLGSTMGDSVFGLISSYTFGLLKISEADTVGKDAIQLGLKTVGDVIIYIVFNSLFFVVYSILLVTLAIVLLVRGIYLWIYMSLSPLFGLSYFFGKDAGGDFLKKFSIGEFVALAMVPVYAMLALSFGFLFLSITMTGISGSTEAGGVSSQNYKIEDDTITIKNLGGKDAQGNDTEFKLTVKGAAFSHMQKSGNSASDFIGGVADLGLGIIGAFFMNIFGIVVFRIAIMAALRSSEITKQITEPIYKAGQSVGELAMKAPTYAPVFGGKSMAELGQASSTFKGNIDSYYSRKGGELGSKFSDQVGFSESDGRKVIRSIQEGFKNVNNPTKSDFDSYIQPGLKFIAEAKNQHDFDEIIKTLVDTKVLDEKKAKNIKYGTKDPSQLANQVWAALNKDKMKKAAGKGMDDLSDLTNLYKLAGLKAQNGGDGTTPPVTNNTEQVINNVFKTNAKIEGNMLTKNTSGGGIDEDKTINKMKGLFKESELLKMKKDDFIQSISKEIETKFDLNDSDAEREQAKKLAIELAKQLKFKS